MEALLYGRKITAAEWIALGPEKLELIGGDILCGDTDRMGFLKLLIENIGLLRTVALFPRDAWIKALET